MQVLPIGVQDFVQMRTDNLLYVDKTGKLLELIQNGRRYFLSRPRRFGKSLTLSTLDAMFSGKAALFKGLHAEEWVTEQAKHPSAVLRFDMSISASNLESSLMEMIFRAARKHKVTLHSETLGGVFVELIEGIFESYGPVVILIDEYDKPILDYINDLAKANEMREVLRSFYTVLKSCDEYLRFVMLTGISKFSKVGVFSTLNNLEDISMDKQYGDIVGYTQQELELYFADRITDAATRIKITPQNLLSRLKDYYDGFMPFGQTALVELEVSDARAHGWVEIYLAGRGWIVVDPTPASTEQETTSFWEAFMNNNNVGDNGGNQVNLGMDTIGTYLETALGGFSYVLVVGGMAVLLIMGVGAARRIRREHALPLRQQVHLEYGKLKADLSKKYKGFAVYRTVKEQLDFVREHYGAEISDTEEQALYYAFFGEEAESGYEETLSMVKALRKVCRGRAKQRTGSI